MNIKHGDSTNGKQQRLYRIWTGIIARCNNKNAKYYGSKGIKVCDEWRDYVNFKKWAEANGYADNLTIDRIDNSKDYCPENCRWATMKEQQRNRTNNHIIEYNNESHTISEWAEIFNINVDVLIYRINNGWDVSTALTTPTQEYNELIEFNGIVHTYKEWSDILKIPYSTLMHRINTQKWSIEKSFSTHKGYTELDSKIIECRNNNQTWSQAEIARYLGCSSAKVCKTLAAHCTE